MVVTDFEIEIDFFQVNPHLRLPFKNTIDSWESTTTKVVEPPKTSKKKSSVALSSGEDSPARQVNKPTLSQVMWAIALMYDYDTPYFNYPEPDRLENALERTSLPKDYKLPVSEIDQYDRLQYDSERRFYRTWSDTTDAMERFLKQIKDNITLDTYADVNKIQGELAKQLKQKDEYLDRINKKKKDNVRGDKELGGLESGLFD